MSTRKRMVRDVLLVKGSPATGNAVHAIGRWRPDVRSMVSKAERKAKRARVRLWCRIRKRGYAGCRRGRLVFSRMHWDYRIQSMQMRMTWGALAPGLVNRHPLNKSRAP